MENNRKRLPALFAGLVLTAAFLRNAAAAAAGCRSALDVCTRLLIPSLFPFFVLSGFLNRLGLPELLGQLIAPAAAQLYGVSGAGASALVMGLMGGYPSGAACIADLERGGKVAPEEAERLLGFCNNSGPAFIVGAIGLGVFGSARIGLLLYGVHVCSAFLTGLFFRQPQKASAVPVPNAVPVSPAAALTASVKQAVSSMLNVCGFSVTFTVLLAVLDGSGLLSGLSGAAAARFGFSAACLRAMLAGIFELGSAAAAMQGLRLCPASLALAAFLVGWGGLSVHFQTLGLLDGCGAKGVFHITGRLISACIGALTAYGLGLLLPLPG